MFMKRIYLSLAFLFIVYPVLLSGESSQLPEPSPIVVSAPPVLSTDDLIALSYYFSGGPPAGFPAFESAIKASIESYKNDPTSQLPQYQRGEGLLKYLHGNLFKRYSEPQTRIDVVFIRGHYNCVSSSLIYMIHARSVGMEVEGVATRAHAFCLVKIDDSRTIDVETTNPFGFDPGTKKDFLDSFGAATGYSYVPPGNYRDRQTINDRLFLGLLIQNRIVELQNQGRMAESLALAVDRVALEGGMGDTVNFYLAVNNAIAFYNGRRQYTQGLELAMEVRARYGDDATLKASVPALLFNLISDAIRAQRWEEAKNLLFDHREEFDLDRFVQLQTSVEKAEIGFLINENRLEEAGIRLAVTPLRPQDRIELSAILYGKEAQILIPEGWEKVWRHLRMAPEELRTNVQFRNLLSTAENNYAIDIRNTFARLANTGDLDQAEAVLLEGIRILGEHRLLVQARQELARVRSRRNS